MAFQITQTTLPNGVVGYEYTMTGGHAVATAGLVGAGIAALGIIAVTSVMRIASAIAGARGPQPVVTDLGNGVTLTQF